MQLLLFCLSLLSYFVLHSILADNRVKEVLYKVISIRFYRLFFNLVSIGLLVGLFYYFNALPTTLLFEAMPMLGSVFMLVGGIIIFLALSNYHLGEFSGWYQLKHKGESPAHSLNQKGLNKYIRHPLYTGNFFLLLGLIIYYPALKVLAVVLISSLYLIIGTRLEEQKLVTYFGETYRKYQREVGRFLPKI